jgi:aryl-alcohol dehydrogenase-like predicted oxidoreductase
MIPQCIDQGVGVLPWSPLARGLLAGTRTREGERLTTRARSDPFGDSLYTPEVDFAVVDRVAEVAGERGVAPAQVALAWLLHKPAVTAPIVGATKVEHLEDALAAEQLALSDDEAARLEEPYVPHELSGISI